jgi:hypothetical protein
MANTDKGEVSLEVGGTSYTLVHSFGGMIDAEDASEPIFGRRLKWDEIAAGVNTGELREFNLFLYALLRKRHKALSVMAVRDLIDDIGGLDALRETLQNTVRISEPDPDDLKALGDRKNGRPRKARNDGTGASSASLPAASA